MKVKLMLDTKRFETKPTGIETGGIQNRISQSEVEISELANILCNGGTCKPAVLEGGNKASNWISQSCFMLDFDHGISIEKAISKTDKFGITPVFLYTSFSHIQEKEHRFRMVFVTNQIVTDLEIRNKLQITLINMFDSDKVTYNTDRIFFGGKGKFPINPNYDARIIAEDIICQYFKEEYTMSKPVNKLTNKKVIKNIIPFNKEPYMDNINAIKELNVDKLRSLLNYEFINELDSDTNKEYTLLSVSPFSSVVKLSSEQDVYDTINSIDLCDFLGIDEGYKVSCILPNHEDSSPSATIWTTKDGTKIYRCFGCNKSLTIIGIVESIAQVKRSVAINFIKSVFNIELSQSEWTKAQVEILRQNVRYLGEEEFTIQFPNISKIIKNRKHHLQLLLTYFTQFVNDGMESNGKPLFYSGYSKLMEVCGIKGNRNMLASSLSLFGLLNLMEKVELSSIPEKELKECKAISARYGFKKLTNFYSCDEFGVMLLNGSEEVAKDLLINNISLKGISRENIIRTYGETVANRIYPQYVLENSKGTSEKSDSLTMEISKFILETIEIQGYVLEKDIKINKTTENQYSRSLQEIFNTYDLVRVKASKDNKLKYNIPQTIAYQSIVICKAID